MSWGQRVKDVAVGVLMLAVSAWMMLHPEDGYLLMTMFLCVALVVGGIRTIAYYLMLARHMVSGKTSLYLGLALLDLGIFSGSLTTLPQGVIMLYLLAGHLFWGVILVLRAREARGLDAPSWKWTLVQGVANVLIAVACVAFFRSARVAVYVYGTGLVYTALLRIASAFQRQAIVYVP